MNDKVADASALAAILFSEPQFEIVLQRLDNTRLFAPSLLRYEIANVCLKKARLRPLDSEFLRDALDRFNAMSIELRDIDARDVFETAPLFKLSAYDASYLCLALELGVELVTLDQRLERAKQTR